MTELLTSVNDSDVLYLLKLLLLL